MNYAKIRYGLRQCLGRATGPALALSEKHKQKSVLSDQNKKLAVIVHLYYPEMWEYVAKNLSAIPEPYDIFVTTTLDKVEKVREMTDGYRVQILSYPNRGRDVLPFLRCMYLIKDCGYSYILKLHSKKSPHRKDGNVWASSIIESLLPSKKIIEKTLQVLDDSRTGVVGPANEYLQLSVNFEANGAHMMHIMQRVFGRGKAHKMLHSNRLDYGFFAGSMFWARFDALLPLLEKRFHNRLYFEKESGQIDGTFAHAIERTFSLIPEGNGRKMYESSSKSVKPIPYQTSNVPDWFKNDLNS